MKIYFNLYRNAEGKMVQSKETFSFREQAENEVLTYVDTISVEVNAATPEPSQSEIEQDITHVPTAPMKKKKGGENETI